MAIASTFSLLEQVNPLRLAGPLFDKELRVSSRRRQTYALRLGYVALMCVYALAAWCWIMMRPNPTTTVFAVSRYAEVAQRITQSILWFQFLAAQLVAVVMLSSSLNDEMRRGGLSVLLTTPVTSMQIVLGKLLSRLWQILLLMALSLPALAVIRSMGGISWGRMVSGFCITVTAVLFIGALCLWLSTCCRHSYQAISTAATIYLVVFIALPGLVTALATIARLNEPLLASIVNLVTPRQAFVVAVYQTRGPAMGTGYFFSWPLHCAIMLSATFVLLVACARRLRWISARTLGATGQRRRHAVRQFDCPVAWRESAADASGFRWGNALLFAVAVVLCGLMVVARVASGRQARIYSGVRDMAWVFWIIALLRLAVLAAGAITREKEGGTWPLLLTTPLDERQIVRGKLRAIASRGAPWVLAALAVQTCFFLVVSSSPDIPWVIVYVLSYCCSVFFVMVAGLYFGLRLKTTTAAIAATLGAELFLRYLVAGTYNPLFIWLRYKVITGSRGNMKAVMIFGVASWLTVAVLQVGLGLFLLRRTQRTLRCYV